jgi:protein TonB
MNHSVDLVVDQVIDEPWRRLPWIAPLSVLLWIALLCGFSKFLERSPAPSALQPVRAQFFEVSVGGLQNDNAHPVVASTPPPRPVPREPPLPKPLPKPATKIVPKPAPEQHPAPPPPESSAAPIPESASSSDSAVATDASASPGVHAALRGGSDHEGAQAVFAPLPKIPDDLREEVFRAEAVARFDVSYNATTTVSLVKATANPRLNQIVLETLKRWRFSPAHRDGVAIDSVFEIRIPITVE